jgi:hypothetical protein
VIEERLEILAIPVVGALGLAALLDALFQPIQVGVEDRGDVRDTGVTDGDRLVLGDFREGGLTRWNSRKITGGGHHLPLRFFLGVGSPSRCLPRGCCFLWTSTYQELRAWR